jgi:cell division protein ZapA
MKQIEVSILDQSYRLACEEGHEASLHAAVARVDREMVAIRDAGRVKARERIAVLAALNLAATPAAPAPEPKAASAQLAQAEEQQAQAARLDRRIDRLIAQLDQALGDDGQLL